MPASSSSTKGTTPTNLLVLMAGRVKLTQLTPDGQQVVLRLIGPGDAFGGVGAFGDPTYPVSAEAVETASALAWNSATMRHLLETQNQIALNALRFVANRYHDLQRRYRQAMTERVERRVARALLRLVHEAGRRVDKGVEIDFPISRQDIAEMTGTTAVHRQPASQRLGRARHRQERPAANCPHEAARPRCDCRRPTRTIANPLLALTQRRTRVPGRCYVKPDERIRDGEHDGRRRPAEAAPRSTHPGESPHALCRMRHCPV